MPLKMKPGWLWICSIKTSWKPERWDFISLNLEEDEGAEMARVLKVSGQTLLIVKGETKVNLTNEGFMNARTNPDKFHEILRTQIDNLL